MIRDKVATALGALRKARRKGIALLVVLLVVVLLETVVADLAYYSVLSLKGARNFSRDLQNTAAVDGIVRVVGEALSDENITPVRRAALIQEGLQGLVLGESESAVSIEEENAKLNLNLLVGNDPEIAEACREELVALFDVLGKDTLLANRIANFVVKSEHGIAILSELRLVEGVTDELLFGLRSQAGGDDEFVLSRYLTCWGDGAINVNTAHAEVIEAVFSRVDPQLGEELLQKRSSKPLEYVVEIEGFFRLEADQQRFLHQRLKTEGDTYTVTIFTRTGDLTAVTRTVVEIMPTGAFNVSFCSRSR